jgi:hypothetical protein
LTSPTGDDGYPRQPRFPAFDNRFDGALDKSPFFEKSVMLGALRLLGHVRVYWGFR